MVVGGYYFIFLPNYYDISIGITTPVDSNGQYMEDFMIIYNHISENKIPLAEELTDTKNDFRMNFYNEHKEDDNVTHFEIKTRWQGHNATGYTQTSYTKEDIELVMV